ncbi:MAG: hypothetical protein IJ653_04305 [Bacteroidales bacterium]|nr:hypothetical protein [Bacteroidales bacterium]
MDIDLLSRMVGELIVGHDQVGLPGVGTFVAEMVPASFSDKGFTINPPYRRLSFSPKCLEDQLLIDLYASSNPIPRETAAAYITQFLAEMKSVLEVRKTIVLPGLGRLRATRENAIFFVPEEGLDIFPGGIGLRPVSLKSHTMQYDDPVVINVPIPIPKPEPEPEPEKEKEIPGQARNDVGQARNDVGQARNDVGQARNDAGQPVQEVKPETIEGSRSEKHFRWWIPVVATVGVVVVALAVFMILARVAPDFIDSILYTPEELRIINY